MLLEAIVDSRVSTPEVLFVGDEVIGILKTVSVVRDGRGTVPDLTVVCFQEVRFFHIPNFQGAGRILRIEKNHRTKVTIANEKGKSRGFH